MWPNLAYILRLMCFWRASLCGKAKSFCSKQLEVAYGAELGIEASAAFKPYCVKSGHITKSPLISQPINNLRLVFTILPKIRGQICFWASPATSTGGRQPLQSRSTVQYPRKNWFGLMDDGYSIPQLNITEPCTFMYIRQDWGLKCTY